jgi:secondary thiamine-phosphate synthase enzyme
MQARYEELSLDTQGDGDILDLTADAQKALDNAGFRDGLCTVFVAHSTCGMTMIECEPGCNADLNRILEQIAPQDSEWRHNELNADSNGHSHARAALIGPSVTIPFANGELMLGTWQKIVCVDFDDRPRSRRVVIQLLGCALRVRVALAALAAPDASDTKSGGPQRDPPVRRFAGRPRPTTRSRPRSPRSRRRSRCTSGR